jgi:hypothetical protein
MGRGTAEGGVESQHIHLQHNKFYAFQVVVRGKTSNTRRNKIDMERIKAIENLHGYQAETRAWRDKKVKEKTIEVKDLVLLQSPRIESSRQLQPKWIRPYLKIEKKHRRQDVVTFMEC